MMFLVKRRQIATMVSLVIVVLALLLATAWWFLESQRTQALASVETLKIQRENLLKTVAANDEEIESLARQLAVFQRSTQVKSIAYAKIDEQLRDLQGEILELKEEVAFYRGIVSENSGSARVRIQSFAVESDGGERDYRFRVVLTRSKRNDKVASGTISLSVDGEQDGQAKRLRFSELTAFPAAKLTFKFKHFQRISGRFALPKGFTPKHVVVQISSNRAGSRPSRETFSWSVEHS